MTGAVQLHSSSYSRTAVARLRPALAASALMHLALLSALPMDTPWGGVASYRGDAPITVRLAAPPAPVPDVPASPEPGERRMPRQPGPPAANGERVRSEFFSTGASQTGTEVLALPQAPDANYYGARDLDRYPRPLAAFQFDQTAGDGAREVRLEVLIDERGIVQHMTFAGPAAPARVEEALRAALAATRFLPAQKDGRAVRSRILLSVTFGAEKGEQ